MLGETIAHYKITAKLGEGGMGAVYRATDTKLNREVAIKVLPETFAADPDRLARFTREAQVLASLNHPNIATIFGVEDKALIMELVEGNDLSGPLPLNEALQIAKQIAEGLEAAHDKGIIHRDLKPANIKVTPEGTVKLLDFGLAKATDSAATATSADSPTMTIRATQAGLIMGTAGYMSPEQAAGKPVDKRADIWAFGVVLHELLTGKKLFHGETVSHTLASVLKDPIDLAIPQAPKPIQQLLARCLDRNLKHRYKDIGEARIAIEDYLANPQQKEQARPATRPALWMALAALSLLLAVATTTLWLRNPKASARPVHFTLQPNVGTPVISPDGQWMLAGHDGHLRVRRLQEGSWVKIGGTEGYEEQSTFWSDDSSSFGFLSGDRLRIATVDGSPSRDLMPVTNFRGASLRGSSKEGTLLVASAGKLQTFDLRSSQLRDLPLKFEKSNPPNQPVFLPEGDGFVFLLDRGEETRLFRSTLNSSAMEPLSETNHRVVFARHPSSNKWHIFFTKLEEGSRSLFSAKINPRAGDLLSDPIKLVENVSTAPSYRARFSVANDGVLTWRYFRSALPVWRLSWKDLQGNTLARLAENRKIASLALSPDESRVAVQIEEPEAHIWIYNSTTGIGKAVSNSPARETQPFWAADGQSLFYFSESGGKLDLRRHYLQSGVADEVIWKPGPTDPNFRTQNGAVVLARDRELIFKVNGRLWRLDLNASSPRKLYPLETYQSSSPGTVKLSPDGRLIVTSTRGGMSVEAYPANGEPPLHYGTGKEPLVPFFSPDGRILYAVAGSGTLMAYPVLADQRLGSPTNLFNLITSNRTLGTFGAASRDGKRLLLIEADDVEEFRNQVLTDWTTLLPK
jgi:serine/threonine protein kinase/Tol biopolymer transport system component